MNLVLVQFSISAFFFFLRVTFCEISHSKEKHVLLKTKKKGKFAVIPLSTIFTL